MGWTFTTRATGQTIKEFFTQEFHSSKPGEGVRDCATVNRSTAYVAYRYADGHIHAIVCLLEYPTRDGDYNIGYKDMSENMGPYYYDCPLKILNQLTDLPPMDPSADRDIWADARKWRATCRARLAAKSSLREFDVITFAEPIHFNNGRDLTQFAIRLKAGRPRFYNGGQQYSIRHWADAPHTITHQTAADVFMGRGVAVWRSHTSTR